jgi:hypothetical protein
MHISFSTNQLNLAGITVPLSRQEYLENIASEMCTKNPVAIERRLTALWSLLMTAYWLYYKNCGWKRNWDVSDTYYKTLDRNAWWTSADGNLEAFSAISGEMHSLWVQLNNGDVPGWTRDEKKPQNEIDENFVCVERLYSELQEAIVKEEKRREEEGIIDSYRLRMGLDQG